MVQIENLTKRYGKSVAVNEISLTIKAGEILVLLGGSGSGKTTTLKMINRLIDPTSGRIFLDGADVTAIEPHQLRRRIGYVFQQVGLFPHMTVAENVAITPSLLGWDKDRTHKRVNELLELVELDPTIMRNRNPSELSGGQQQRVGVARALAAKPNVMLLDEPFGALDPLTRSRLQDSFVRICRRTGVTSVFVSHDIVEALVLGDRIGVMENGRLIQVGTPRELMCHPANDYVQQLISTPQRQASIVDALLKRET